jgi:hypothetical protein
MTSLISPRLAPKNNSQKNATLGIQSALLHAPKVGENNCFVCHSQDFKTEGTHFWFEYCMCSRKNLACDLDLLKLGTCSLKACVHNIMWSIIFVNTLWFEIRGWAKYAGWVVQDVILEWQPTFYMWKQKRAWKTRESDSHGERVCARISECGGNDGGWAKTTVTVKWTQRQRHM